MTSTVSLEQHGCFVYLVASIMKKLNWLHESRVYFRDGVFNNGRQACAVQREAIIQVLKDTQQSAECSHQQCVKEGSEYSSALNRRCTHGRRGTVEHRMNEDGEDPRRRSNQICFTIHNAINSIERVVR